jgi:hypothetical protein
VEPVIDFVEPAFVSIEDLRMLREYAGMLVELAIDDVEAMRYGVAEMQQRVQYFARRRLQIHSV